MKKHTKGKKEERKRKKLKKLRTKPQMRTQTIQAIIWSRGGSATPMDGETRDANTPMQEADEDAEMKPSEVGTEDPDLKDIAEREGIDLSNILEQWKR
jgi:hypothetical protein